MSYDTNYDDIPFSNESLPEPDFFDFKTVIPASVMIYSSAHFYRTQYNTNIELNINLGSNISPIIWLSPSIYLPDNIFNLTKPVDEISYPNSKDVLILKDMTFLHDILIQYKMTKADNNNFLNQRELRCTLVRDDGTSVYDSALFANQQPDTGQHDNIFLKGHITHNLADVVRLKFNVIQDNKLSGQSDTKIKIFRITWNILGLRNSHI